MKSSEWISREDNHDLTNVYKSSKKQNPSSVLLYLKDSPSLRRQTFFSFVSEPSSSSCSLRQKLNPPGQRGNLHSSAAPGAEEGEEDFSLLPLQSHRLFFSPAPLPAPLPRRRLPLPPGKRYLARYGARDGPALLQVYRHLLRVSIGHPLVVGGDAAQQRKEGEEEKDISTSRSEAVDPISENLAKSEEENRNKRKKQGQRQEQIEERGVPSEDNNAPSPSEERRDSSSKPSERRRRGASCTPLTLRFFPGSVLSWPISYLFLAGSSSSRGILSLFLSSLFLLSLLFLVEETARKKERESDNLLA